MPRVTLDQTLEMYYEDDDYTDPWREPEAVVLHHGNAKNSFLWYAWVPLLARQYRVVAWTPAASAVLPYRPRVTTGR